MPAHISESLAIHMSQQAVSHQKEVEELQTEIKELCTKIGELRTHLRIMPIDIIVDGYAAKKAEGKGWSSAPFYTHLQGYKMYLSVHCNGCDDGEGTHVSVYMFTLCLVNMTINYNGHFMMQSPSCWLTRRKNPIIMSMF